MTDRTDSDEEPESSEVTFVDPAWWFAHEREAKDVFGIVAYGAYYNVLGRVSEKRVRGDDELATAKPRPERLTLTVEEAAEALGVSRALAYEAVRRDEIPHVRIGRRILVPRAALERLLESTGGTQEVPEG